MTLPETILSRIFVMEDGCHYWLGWKNTKGYGGVTLHGKKWKVHRLIWCVVGNDLPDYEPGGLQIDHLCRNTSCCNPAHLQVVDQPTNMKRAVDQRTHCKAGHPWNEHNTYTYPDGGRMCRECGRRYAREWKKRHKGN